MRFIPNAVALKVGRSILLGQKHSPTILFAAGVVGAVTSTVLACRATLYLDATLEETNKKLNTAYDLHEEVKSYTDEKWKHDVTVLYVRRTVAVAKLYAPAAAVGALSIIALTGSHKILTNRNAGLTAAYAALDKGFRQYRKRVVDEFGEDKDREFRYSHEMCEVDMDDAKGKKSKMVSRVGPDDPSVYARFFDEYSQSWEKTPEYNLLFLKCQQQYANDLLRSRGHIFLNEVYDMLGIDRSQAGTVVGWVISKEGDNFVDFGVFDGDNPRARDFVNGREGSILLDFNVDGVIYDRI